MIVLPVIFYEAIKLIKSSILYSKNVKTREFWKFSIVFCLDNINGMIQLTDVFCGI
jgi:hypothetical protein